MRSNKTWPIDRRLWNAPISVTLPAGASQAGAVRACAQAMSDFSGVPIGEIDVTGASNKPTIRGQMLFGKAAAELRARGFEYFVEGGRLNIDKASEPPESWPTATPKRRGGRPKAPYWIHGYKFIDEWLKENGCPAPGDGGQAKLELAVMEFLAQRTETPPVRSVARVHVVRRMQAYRARLK